MKKTIVVCSLAIALLSGSSSLWLNLKSELGQVLLDRAWSSAVDSGETRKAWPWADTWPVARLSLPGTDRSLVVLEGISGEAMAFGPGRVPESSTTAGSGTYVLGGHRDSHLAFLEHAERGDIFELQSSDGAVVSFELVDSYVANVDTDQLLMPSDAHALVMVTCYPFHALQTGGPLRYVVVALPVESA